MVSFQRREIAMEKLLLLQILCIDWVLIFKNASFESKFIKYLMELTWAGSNHLKVFWEIDALSSFSGTDVFLRIWILFALDVYY